VIVPITSSGSTFKNLRTPPTPLGTYTRLNEVLYAISISFACIVNENLHAPSDSLPQLAKEVYRIKTRIKINVGYYVQHVAKTHRIANTVKNPTTKRQRDKLKEPMP
jgi:hypothetical protein